jgi:hypothetical protein
LNFLLSLYSQPLPYPTPTIFLLLFYLLIIIVISHLYYKKLSNLKATINYNFKQLLILPPSTTNNYLSNETFTNKIKQKIENIEFLFFK